MKLPATEIPSEGTPVGIMTTRGIPIRDANMQETCRLQLPVALLLALLCGFQSGCGPAETPSGSSAQPDEEPTRAVEEARGESPASPFGMLISAVELKDRLSKPDLRILDVRPREDYGAGHIPHAAHTSLNEWKSQALADGGLHDEEAWSRIVGNLGIDQATNVVVYAEKPTDATRIWWTLKYLGVGNVAVLDGGWRAWQETGGEATTETVPALPLKFFPQFQPDRLAEIAQLKSLLRDEAVTIVDTRSSEEFDGSAGPAARKGRIPGAVHLEWKELLDQQGRFKTKAELVALFEQRGIAADKTAVTYCQSGGRASLDAFALELAGYRNVQNYYCSWQEWSADTDAPVEK